MSYMSPLHVHGDVSSKEKEGLSTWSSNDVIVVKVTSSCEIVSERTQGLLEAYFKIQKQR